MILMLKDRNDLEKLLLKYVTNSVTKENSLSNIQKWCLTLQEEYNIPVAMSTDIFSQRKDISEYNDFILFAITDVVRPKRIEEYFTSTEIGMFREQKYVAETIKFPIKLHLIQIEEDQYIGKVTAQFLMDLRQKQLINYNADTQRALRIMLKGGTKILRPYIDIKSVAEIDTLYSDHNFIPNMITLNINLDDENADYKYDPKEEILKIYNISAFDIVDGYHRYLGMSRNYDRDNNWDYNMMLQVTMFSVGRARQFIYQENHKTKMKELDSAAYDQNNAGNLVVNRINTETDSNLRGDIGLGDEHINAGVMAKVINRLWFPKKANRGEIIRKSKEIQQKLNKFTEEVESYLEREWDSYEIIIVLYGLYNDYTTTQICDVINNLSDENKALFNRLKDVNAKTSAILKEVFS